MIKIYCKFSKLNFCLRQVRMYLYCEKVLSTAGHTNGAYLRQPPYYKFLCDIIIALNPLFLCNYESIFTFTNPFKLIEIK